MLRSRAVAFNVLELKLLQALTSVKGCSWEATPALCLWTSIQLETSYWQPLMTLPAACGPSVTND